MSLFFFLLLFLFFVYDRFDANFVSLAEFQILGRMWGFWRIIWFVKIVEFILNIFIARFKYFSVNFNVVFKISPYFLIWSILLHYQILLFELKIIFRHLFQKCSEPFTLKTWLFTNINHHILTRLFYITWGLNLKI